MASNSDESGFDTLHQVRIGLLFLLGLVLFVIGIGQVTDIITWTTPAIVYFLLGLALCAYGIYSYQ
jgi:F0F1-type ATP synthase assembly protein I